MRLLAVVVTALAVLLLPAAAQAAVTKEEIRVPMRDGVELAVDLYKPDVAPGEKLPVIVTLTPYHDLYKGLGDAQALEGYRFTEQGYAFAMVDVRGTYESGGCWDYGGLKERQDGYDLVEWLGTQPWSSGKVAMIGASYDGTTANAAAVEQPPHLATIVPISAISRWWGYAYTQGARHSYSGESGDIDPPSDTPADFMFVYGFLPPPEPGSMGAAAQIAQRWTPCDRAEQTAHGYDPEPDYDDFWKERDYLRLADRVNVPVLVTHGLQDYNVKTWEGTQWFEALKVPKAMVIGQFGHAVPPWEGWNDYLDRWFARWLKGEQNGIESEPPVIVESTDGEYRTRSRWAGTGRRVATLGTEDVDFFDDGALTESEMLRDACSERCVRLKLSGLGETHIMGRPRLNLRATSDQASTHFVAVLLDVAPNGTSKVVSRGFMNARYRGGREIGEDVPVGQAETFDLDLIDKDAIIPADHELHLIIASSSTTWVLSDERRASNVLHLAQSTLEIPVDGPDSGAPIVAQVVSPPSPAPAATKRSCRRKATIKLKKKPKGRVRVTVNGRRVKKPRVRGRRVTVALPRTRTGRVVIRITARKLKVTRRVRGCRRG